MRAGCLELDEARLVLTVNGEPVRLEAKPLALLQTLLRHGGSVVSKDALIEAAWGNAAHTSAASLANGISKIRQALGEAARDLIEVVHGSGYRIGAHVEIVAIATAPKPPPSLEAGDVVPGRGGWRLEAFPGPHPPPRTWLARETATGAIRVLKFASTPEGLLALQREAALAQTLQTALGTRPDLPALLGTNFERPPYFTEWPLLGPDFARGAAITGKLAAISLTNRLACLAALARTIASAHAAGVLHGRLEPSHLLVLGNPATWLRLAPISYCGGGAAGPPNAEMLAYAAPERGHSRDLTIGMDVYALGVLLYQCVTADLSEPLGIGWEARIADPLLREDIALAACADPARRLPSAGSLAERLETLGDRRRAAGERERIAAEAAAWQRIAERNRLRRPWVIAVACSLVAGIGLTGAFALRASAARDAARHQAELANAVVSFLTIDLLGRSNPAQSSRPDETLMAAAGAAEADIDHRLAGEPLLAGALHLAFAASFQSRDALNASRSAYDAAIAAFGRAGGAGRADRVIAALRLAGMDALSGKPGSLDRARALIGVNGAKLGALGLRQAEARVWLDAARAQAEMLGGDIRVASAAFAAAADAADAMPSVFDAATRIRLRQQEAVTYLRLGKWAEAARLFTALHDRSLALQGPRHPDTLELALDMAETQTDSGKMSESVASLDRIEPDVSSVFGPSHQITLNLLSTRSGALTWLGRYERAIADQSELLARVTARDGARSLFALAAGIDLAELLCRAGRTQAGMDLARSVVSRADAAFGVGSTVAQASHGKLAFCMVLGGDGQAALKLLDGIDIARVSEMTSDPLYAAEVDLMRAAVSCASGTRRDIAPVATVLDRGDADPFYRKWSRRLAVVCQSPAGAVKGIE